VAADLAPKAVVGPSLNPEFVAISAEELIAHLNHHCRMPGFTGAKLVFSTRELLTTKKVHFVKLSKCVTNFTIVFLSSRWSKNIYATSNLGSE
jgi:hypothetical protein